MKSLFARALKDVANFYKAADNAEVIPTEKNQETVFEYPPEEREEGTYEKEEIELKFTLKNFKNKDKASFKIDSVAYDVGYKEVGA